MLNVIYPHADMVVGRNPKNHQEGERKMNNKIQFNLRSEVSMAVLREIAHNFPLPEAVRDGYGDLAFVIELDQESTNDFINEYEWSISWMAFLNGPEE